MSEKFLCARQEGCPLVLGACERKVMAESEARIASADLAKLKSEYEAKKPAMNELYSAGVSMRKAQREYFKNRSQQNLYKAKDAEDRFDKALRSCHALSHPDQPPLFFGI